MAWSGPALTKVVAAANGTNNFALSDPSSQGPYRTDVQAVADGSLVNGRTVHYGAWRTTTENDAEFEEGHGVYTAATRTIARTAGNVLDGSNGPGVLVDFGLSGQMDILFYPVLDGSNIPSPAEFAANLGLARLAAENTYTLNQTISRAIGSVLILKRDAATAGVAGDVLYQALNASSAAKNFARVRGSSVDVAAGSEDGRIQFFLTQNGTEAEKLRLDSDGSLSAQPSGNKYDAFPSGQVLLSESAPPGWTRGDVTGGRLIKLATSADTLGAQGGSDDFFDGALATQGHTLQVTEIPSHSHSIKHDNNAIDGSLQNVDMAKFSIAGDLVGAVTRATTTAGGGGAHAHLITTPNYRVMGRIVKS